MKQDFLKETPRTNHPTECISLQDGPAVHRPCCLTLISYHETRAVLDHIMARLKGANIDDIRNVLKADAADHAKQGLVLRHIWRNADDPDEIVFIFTAADLSLARKYIEAAHEQVRKDNPVANMPEMLYLKGE